MKKNIFSFILLAIVSLTISSCKKNGTTEPVTKTYTVTFNTLGGTTIADVNTESLVAQPQTPTLESSVFKGWSLKEEGELVTFPLKVEQNTTLYAQWASIFTTQANIDGTISIKGYDKTIYTGKDSNIKIPEMINNKKVTSILSYAFGYNQNIKNLTLPASIVKLESNSFGNGSLSTITILSSGSGAKVIELVGVPFENVTLTDIKVPAGTADAYKAASGWSKYASVIHE